MRGFFPDLGISIVGGIFCLGILVGTSKEEFSSRLICFGETETGLLLSGEGADFDLIVLILLVGGVFFGR